MLLTAIVPIGRTVDAMDIRLDDGTELSVRRIRPDDKPLLSDALGAAVGRVRARPLPGTEAALHGE